MARRVLYETNYTFVPSTKTIVIQRYIPRERLILITNVTTGVPIFNFSDSRLTATSYSATASYTGAAGGQGSTTIVLAYNTTAMSSGDKLQIMLDEPNEFMTPSETLMDPVGKLRVSTPQSLIDTDFEYGLQPTKWENIQLVNNRASAFFLPNQPYGQAAGTTAVTNITTTTGSRSVTVATTTPPAVGSVVQITNTLYPPAEGFYVVDTVSAGTNFTYLMKNNAVSTGSIFLTGQTLVFNGGMYTGAAIPTSSVVTGAVSLSTVVIADTAGGFTCASTPLFVGQYVTISGTLGGTGSITGYSGSPITYRISATNGSTTFTLQTTGGSAIVTTAGTPTGLTYSAGAQVTVTTSYPHGLHIGNYVVARGYTASVANPPNGTFVVTSVTSPTVFTYQALYPAVGTIAAGTIMPRPEGVFYHRPFDGGVQYNCGSSFHGLQAFRQTRRYFRYQSGKGIQMSTNVIFKPGLNIDQITNPAGNVAQVRTKIAHNLSPGVSITVSGATPTAYNVTANVLTVIDAYTFTYTISGSPGALTAGIPYMVINNWYNSTIRVGMFDSQNGFFFEFDGQNLYAGRRNTTLQLSGNVSVTQNQGAVTGTNTYFSKQLTPGDFISIRGMTYRVHTITSDTAMTILPEYRGATIAGVTVSKTVDTKVIQGLWNIDPMNGSGPSGYNLDLTKAQMLYMDYSWYGAGAVRFGFKDIKGEIQYVHRYTHNNTQTEAYMRSGNLPARYETNTLGAYTYITATLAAGGTTLTVADTSLFPSSGALMIQNPASASYEYVNYTGKTATTFTGLTRGLSTATGTAIASVVTTSGSATITSANITSAAVQPGMFISGAGIPDGTYVVSIVSGSSAILSQACTASATIVAAVFAMGAANPTHTYSATAPIGVYGHTPQFSPFVSHWGSSVIMDGRFDDDKSFVFTTGMLTSISVGSANTNALMSLRIAPSVDNGITSTLGLREIINRMQLTLRGTGVRTDGNFLVQLFLNATLNGASNSFIQPVGNPSSLAQITIHPAATTVTGGEVVYAFYTEGSGAGSFSTTTQDITLIRDLGNSVVGGGTNNFANSSGQVYPDGPDVLTVVVTNLEASARNATCRISWTEAQA